MTAAPCATTMSVNAKPPEDSHSLIVADFIAGPISNCPDSLGKSQNASHCSRGSGLLWLVIISVGDIIDAASVAIARCGDGI
jgi:hypothetical protein